MSVDETVRAQRRAWLKAHLDAENNGDMDGVMTTFAPAAVMEFNTARFPSPEHILAAHQYMGFQPGIGAFRDVANVTDRESFTDTDIVVEGRFCGVHVGEYLGFAPSGRAVELPFVAFYGFGDDGKLVSERVTMNLGPLLQGFHKTPEG